jgi:Ca2+-binding RTX toxin-like protein
MFEQLEGRQLLSAAFSVVDGTLIVRGTRNADQIRVDLIGAAAPAVVGGPAPNPQVLVVLNGRQRTFDPATLQGIRIEAGAGDDQVLLGPDPFNSPPFAAGSTDLPATLLGGDGDDTLVGGQANDLLLGGNGRDALAGSYGDDTLDAGSGSDELLGQDGNDVMLGGRGEDRFTLQGDDTVDGGLGNDRIFAQRGVDTVIGGAGNDDLWALAPADVTGEPNEPVDTLNGGLGNDVFHVRDGEADNVDCGEGHDVVKADFKDVVASNCDVVKRRARF